MGGTLRSLVRDVVAWAGELAVFVLVAALVISNRLVPISSTFLQAEFDLLKRPVSGDVLLVQVDSRSVQEMGAGPLQRRSIAKVLDVLKDAGAAAVWLDINVQPEPQNAVPDALQREIAAAGDTVVLASGAWKKRSELPLLQLAEFLQVEQGAPLRTFTVDGMINDRAVPSLSLLDVYDANFNLEAVKGKRVILIDAPPVLAMAHACLAIYNHFAAA